MRLGADVIIPDEKLVKYLLVPRMWDDKSKFLMSAGFALDNPLDLRKALATLAMTAEAVHDRRSEYGDFLRTDGQLIGPTGRVLQVTAIWLRWKSDGSNHFITLKPRREKLK